MSIIQGTAKSGGTVAASFYDYPIGDSLRFDGSSYLSRTFGSGDQQTWTYSFWMKRGLFSPTNGLFAANNSTTAYDWIIFNGDDKLYFVSNPSSTRELFGVARIRDTSAWYHFVFVMKTTNTPTFAWYINGVSEGATGTFPSASSTGYFNSAVRHVIGVSPSATDTFMNGYLANIQFIDGQALDQYFFGEFKDNIWVPYNAFSTAGSGTATASDADTATDSYGTNGFHLDFADSSNIGNDVSGNNNDWTVN